MSDGPRPIGVFVDRFPVLSETFVINEVEALVDLGHAVSVEARRLPDAVQRTEDVRAAVHHSVRESRAERLLAVLWLAARHPVRAAADALARRRWPPDERPTPTWRLAVRARRLSRLGADVHLHTHFATSVCDEAQRIGRILGATTSLTAHAFDIYVEPHRHRLPRRVRRSDLVTSGCDYTVTHLRRVAGPEREHRVVRQVMGVDAAAFTRSGPLPGTRHVAAVGRLVEKKGFVHLVRAAVHLPDVTISIVGEGPERAALEREIAACGVAERVTLLGAASPSGVRELLERADLICMPCVVGRDGDRDSMPVVVKEAMAMELLVVASDEVGLPELVRAPWGRLAPPGDHAALAAAIADMLALSAIERAAAGAAGRRYVEAHASVAVETARLSDLIAACRR